MVTPAVSHSPLTGNVREGVSYRPRLVQGGAMMKSTMCVESPVLVVTLPVMVLALMICLSATDCVTRLSSMPVAETVRF